MSDYNKKGFTKYNMLKNVSGNDSFFGKLSKKTFVVVCWVYECGVAFWKPFSTLKENIFVSIKFVFHWP